MDRCGRFDGDEAELWIAARAFVKPKPIHGFFPFDWRPQTGKDGVGTVGAVDRLGPRSPGAVASRRGGEFAPERVSVSK